MANNIFKNFSQKLPAANHAATKIQLNPLECLLIPIDKLTNVLFDIEKEDPEEILENRKLGITTPISLTLPKDKHGQDIQLTQFDKLIFWIALSEQNAGNFCVSHSRIFHTLGGSQKLNDAPNVKAAITDSLRKLRNTTLTADLTALTSHFKSYKRKLETLLGTEIYSNKIILEDSLLPTKTVTASINGKITDGVIYFHDISILLTIAEMKQQLIHCQPELLAAPVRSTVQTLCLKGYLLERILKIKGSHSDNRKRVRPLNNTILFDTIYSKCGLADAQKWQKQDFRKSISTILEHFKTQNLIKSYEFTKKNGKFYSIIVIF